MVTLIFLASIALLEYVLRRPERGERADVKPDPVGEPVATNLHHLGNALESFGRGKEPEKGAERGGELKEWKGEVRELR